MCVCMAAEKGRGGNSSSWLDAFKKAFTKHMIYTPNMIKPIRRPQPDKRSKRRWIFKKTGVDETTIIHESVITNYSINTSDDDDDAIKATTTITNDNDDEALGLQKQHINNYNAALVIQTLFRGYLARRALEALKGVVKLQALVRGDNVRRRAKMTLKCMQALLRVQARVCDQRRNNHISSSSNIQFMQGNNNTHYSIHHQQDEEEEFERGDWEWDSSRRSCYPSPPPVKTDTSCYSLISPSTCKTSQNQQQRRISPANHHHSSSSSPLLLLQSPSSRIKGKSGGEPSYMSATESATARISAAAAARQICTVDDERKTTSARKRLCFNSINNVSQQKYMMMNGGRASDAEEMDYCKLRRRSKPLMPNDDDDDYGMMERRLSISCCCKEYDENSMSQDMRIAGGL